MSQFAANLLAEQTLGISTNGVNYPFHFHKLNADVCMSMFLNIVTPLVFSMYRTLGASTPVNAADVASLTLTARHVAFIALEAMYNQLYNKAYKLSATAVRQFGNPAVQMSNEFPVFISALITSAGPIQFDNIPARGIHIPFLVYDEVQALLPTNTAGAHEPFRVGMFAEAMTRSREYLSTIVDINTTTSSAWWTFHVWAQPERNGSASYRMYSPVKFPDVQDELKLGVLFAKEKLTSGPGVVNFSSSPFFDINDPPRRNNLPAIVWQFPHYIESQPAYHLTLERDPPHDQSEPSYTPASPDLTLASSSRLPETGRTTRSDTNNKKRKRTDGSAADPEDDTVTHRAIFFYYDHIVCDNINHRQLNTWAIELNKQ
jgi:hypothetical protein